MTYDTGRPGGPVDASHPGPAGHLPPVIIVALLFGVLRKEMALRISCDLRPGGRRDLSTVLTPQQMFVFALVMATYMPCLGVMAALIKEFDIRSTLLITISSVALAIVLGTIANYTFQLIALL